jgi:hypothetical protein
VAVNWRELQHDMFLGLQFVAAMHHHRFAREHPRASQWTDVWAEVRHVIAPGFEQRFMSCLVTVENNTRTKDTHQVVLLSGTGDTITDSMQDLVVQMRKEFPDVYTATPTSKASTNVNIIPLKATEKCYPIGVFGHNIIGRS